MTIPREDINAITIGTIVGVILYNFATVFGNGPLFEAIIGALYTTANYINITDSAKDFLSVMFFFIAFFLQVINIAFGTGAAGAIGGLIFAALISTAFIHPPDNPFFNPFQYKPIFAAIAGICAGGGVLTVFFPGYLIRLFTHSEEFPLSVDMLP